MAFSTAMLASEAFALIRNYVPQYKAEAQGALAVMAAGSINTDYAFGMLDALRAMVTNLGAWGAVTDLNVYATDMGYPGTMTTDCAAIATAAQDCIDWVVANFPAADGYLLDYSMNSDGTRTPRVFTSTDTGGLQSLMSALIATIS